MTKDPQNIKNLPTLNELNIEKFYEIYFFKFWNIINNKSCV